MAFKAKGIQAVIDRLHATDREVTKALRRSIDQTTTGVRRWAVQNIASETQIRPAVLNKHIKVVARTTQARLEGVVVVSSKAMQIRDIKHRVDERTGAVFADISALPGVGMVLLKYAFWPGRKSLLGKPLHKKKDAWRKTDILERAVIDGRRVEHVPVRWALGPPATKLINPLLDHLKIFAGEELVRRFLIELEKVRSSKK